MTHPPVPFRFNREETRQLSELSHKMDRLATKQGPGWQREWILAWRQAGRIVNRAVQDYHRKEQQSLGLTVQT